MIYYKRFEAQRLDFDRLHPLINILILILLVGLTEQPLGAKPNNAAGAKTQPTMFSTPDAEADVVPTFVTNKGQPLSLQSHSHSRLPSFRHVKSLKGLTVEQKRAIANLESDTNIRIHALQERIFVLNQRLDVGKAHPDELVFVQQTYVTSPEKLKQEIAELRKNIADRRQLAEQSLALILTAQQLNQIDRMRQGELPKEAMPSVDGEHLKTFSSNQQKEPAAAAEVR